MKCTRNVHRRLPGPVENLENVVQFLQLREDPLEASAHTCVERNLAYVGDVTQQRGGRRGGSYGVSENFRRSERQNNVLDACREACLVGQRHGGAALFNELPGSTRFRTFTFFSAPGESAPLQTAVLPARNFALSSQEQYNLSVVILRDAEDARTDKTTHDNGDPAFFHRRPLLFFVHPTEDGGPYPQESRDRTMASPSAPRSEIGALGYVRQNGMQADRSSFRGLGGRPQGVNGPKNPNHAPQRVSPRPWAGVATIPPGSVVHPLSAAAGQDVPEAPPPLGGFSQKASAASAPTTVGSQQPAPAATPLAVTPPSAVTTLDTLTGFTADAELKENLAGCRARLDAVGLRLSSQDNALKSLERSVVALREEYNKISQATDAQSILRLEACERTLMRLETAFQEFSSRLQRELRETEQSFAANPAQSVQEALFAPEPQAHEGPVTCRLLEDEDAAEGGLAALDLIQLHLPLHVDDEGVSCLYRHRFDPSTGSVGTLSFKLTTPQGEPRVLFI